MSFKSALVFAPLLLAAACAGEVTGAESTDPSDPSSPGPDAVQQISGEYEVTSVFDLRDAPDMPGIVSGVLGPLGRLNDDPAGALFEALQGTGLGDLVESLPDATRELLEEQINEYIQEHIYEGIPVAGQVAEITDLIASILTHFEVVTELRVGTVDPVGNASGEHRLTSIAFLTDEERNEIAIPEIIGLLATARDVSLNFDVEYGTMNMGDHELQLPLGDFAVPAFHAALESELGITDLGAALNDMINCDGLASGIGEIRVGGLLVLTVDQLSDYCQDGLNQAAGEVDGLIRQLETAQLRFAGGDGTFKMVSQGDDVGSTELSDMLGEWQSELGINDGYFAAPSQFSAVRKN